MQLHISFRLRAAVMDPIAIGPGFARDVVVALLRLPYFALAAACVASVVLTLIFLISTLAGIAAGYSAANHNHFSLVRLGAPDWSRTINMASKLCCLSAACARSQRFSLGGLAAELSMRSARAWSDFKVDGASRLWRHFLSLRSAGHGPAWRGSRTLTGPASAG